MLLVRQLNLNCSSQLPGWPELVIMLVETPICVIQITCTLFFVYSDMRPDIPSKVCFVNFDGEKSVKTALHLTNTIFIDRALIVAKSRYGLSSN